MNRAHKLFFVKKMLKYIRIPQCLCLFVKLQLMRIEGGLQFQLSSRTRFIPVNVIVNIIVKVQPHCNGHFCWWRELIHLRPKFSVTGMIYVQDFQFGNLSRLFPQQLSKNLLFSPRPFQGQLTATFSRKMEQIH